ncbi:uncharacterized protein LOC126996399 isoform X2 [Eriocheir sinensis]|uniref:uncharacterized protein LOC126996399 isoform X2 n=1 Tax=Eriocheir sinensis TaxID=95602 RepID=UPI0021C6D8F4|nr:uncharacterized protein LOC126996399 isoform X2 [Eriocheir sinensis]
MEICDLPTTVLLIKFVEEGDSAMGTVMLLNFLNAWKVQVRRSKLQHGRCLFLKKYVLEPNTTEVARSEIFIFKRTVQPPRRAQRPHPARQPAHPGTHTASPFRQETDRTRTTTTTTGGGGGGGWYTGVTVCGVSLAETAQADQDARTFRRCSFSRGKEVMLVNSDDLYISVDSTLLGTVL